MASTISLDEGSRLRRSHTQDGVLSRDARSASRDNTRKKTANAAGVSTQGRDVVAIGQTVRHTLRSEEASSNMPKSIAREEIVAL